MENKDILDQGYNAILNQSGLSSKDKGYFDTPPKWAKFLGSIGFIFKGLIVVIAALFMFTLGGSLGSTLGSNSPLSEGMLGFGVGFLYILLALPYFFISLYMYRFSTKTQTAFYSSNDAALTEAFKNLRNFFRLMGILTVAILVLYLVVILFAVGSSMKYFSYWLLIDFKN